MCHKKCGNMLHIYNFITCNCHTSMCFNINCTGYHVNFLYNFQWALAQYNIILPFNFLQLASWLCDARLPCYPSRRV